MRPTTRFLAVPAAGLLLAAAAAPALAHSDAAPTPPASPLGIASLHQRMVRDNPGMARMHEQMTGEATPHPPSESTH